MENPGWKIKVESFKVENQGGKSRWKIKVENQGGKLRWKINFPPGKFQVEFSRLIFLLDFPP